MKPGIYPRLPYAQYDVISATNFSKLKELARSAKQYRYRLGHPRTTKPMVVGAAAHTAILEPHRFLAEYALWDERSEGGNVRPRRGKDWEAFQAANASKRIVKAEEHDLAMAMRDAVRTDECAMKYLGTGDREVTFCWETEAERACKGRVDWLAKEGDVDVLVGVKTTRDIRTVPFGNQCAKLGYYLQWAFYYDGWKTVTGKAPKMVEIAIENIPPHDIAVYLIPDEAIDAGMAETQRLLMLLDECEASNKWPGAVSGEQMLSLPSWVYNADDDISDLGLEVA